MGDYVQLQSSTRTWTVLGGPLIKDFFNDVNEAPAAPAAQRAVTTNTA